MFLGHFGLALAAKKVAPQTSLGTTVLATEFADMLWPLFLTFGWAVEFYFLPMVA